MAVQAPRKRLGLLNRYNDPIQVILYLLGGALLVAILFISINNVAQGNYTVRNFLQDLIFGIAQGSIYALIALGYTLVYGVLLMINFAHSEVFMAGAFIGFFAIYAMDQSGFLMAYTAVALLIVLVVGMAASTVTGVIVERVAYRPLRKAPRLVPLITAIGASITLQQLFLLLFGGATRSYPNVSLYVLPSVFRLDCTVTDGVETCLGLDLIGKTYDVTVFGMQLFVRPLYLIILVIALVLMAALWFIVQRTKVGRAMRSVAEDKDTASLMGVNVDRVIVITFVLGAALAGAAGVMFALYNRQVTAFMGFLPGIKAFTAAVFGGIGNIPGAMAGGLMIGILESVMPSLLGLPIQLKDVVVFGILVLILIFRPSGIFGEVLAKKKV
ncbi:MAG TPA: branched-chain amino acid ABC transporter permease [Aggregatilineales bacterium]|jgi:branched-chain amino acid transport system permease protein|nr:branched-chain amino acid ABC transporter permease [Aggregatilineales bacterium]